MQATEVSAQGHSQSEGEKEGVCVCWGRRKQVESNQFDSNIANKMFSQDYHPHVLISGPKFVLLHRVDWTQDKYDT